MSFLTFTWTSEHILSAMNSWISKVRRFMFPWYTFSWVLDVYFNIFLQLLSFASIKCWIDIYVSKRVVVVKQNCTHCFKTVAHFQRYHVRKCWRITQHAQSQRTCTGTVGCSSIETTLTTFSERSFSFILLNNPLLL